MSPPRGAAQTVTEVGVINLDDRRVHGAAFARCPCGREWVAVFPVGTTALECPGCGIMAPTDEMRAMARYVVDVPAGAFEAFMEFLSTSSGVNYSRLGFEPLHKETGVSKALLYRWKGEL